ncbi:uncharacterized protein [Lepeophtheirus salmonis]|uniref:uncharacterized protein n=1 Tax=Lepeophtheirus salmonis TaxID=72036 RepID=UPI001AE266D0|nr:aspartyl/asparaginyl beta-hydroxylase-like [Lepeophtheirus salmonis]
MITFSRIILILFSYFSIVKSSELCGLEPPKEGNSCGGQEFENNGIEAKWEREMYSKSLYTTDTEWPYKDSLDEADDYIAHNPDKAIQLFNNILNDVKSNRAIYARARTKQIHYVEKENVKIQKEIVDDFTHVIKDEEALKTIWASAYYQLRTIFELSKKLFFDREIDILEYLLFERTEDAFKALSVDTLVSDLIESLYIRRKFEDGAKAFEKALNLTKERNISFTSNYVNFLYGITLKEIRDRKREGNKILRNIEPEGVSQKAITIESLVDKCRKFDFKEVEIEKILKEASKLHMIVSLDQKPIEFIEGIKNQAVWSMESDKEITVHEEEISTLIEIWPSIKKEAEDLTKNITWEAGWLRSPSNWNVTGNWSEYQLFSFGNKRHHQCSRAQETCNFFRLFKASSRFFKGTIKFSVLSPGTKINSFHGPSNTVLRAYLGLSVPHGVKFQIGRKNSINLEEGKVVIFDNSFDRTLINHSPTENLLILSFDLPNPDLDLDTKAVKYAHEARSYFLF